MYVIQHFLNESTEEILTSLYEIANTAVANTLKKSRAQNLNKRIKIFYKKSRLPMQLNIYSPFYESHQRLCPNEALPIDVEVKFPNQFIQLDIKQLEEMSAEKMEASLGLRDKMTGLAGISKPQAAIPKVLKDILWIPTVLMFALVLQNLTDERLNS